MPSKQSCFFREFEAWTTECKSETQGSCQCQLELGCSDSSWAQAEPNKKTAFFCSRVMATPLSYRPASIRLCDCFCLAARSGARPACTAMFAHFFFFGRPLDKTCPLPPLLRSFSQASSLLRTALHFYCSGVINWESRSKTHDFANNILYIGR